MNLLLVDDHVDVLIALGDELVEYALGRGYQLHLEHEHAVNRTILQEGVRVVDLSVQEVVNASFVVST